MRDVVEKIIVGLVVGMSAVYLAVRAWRAVTRKDSGCGGCDDCPSRARCEDGDSGKIDESKKGACARYGRSRK